jgi:hypothetical protein
MQMAPTSPTTTICSPRRAPATSARSAGWSAATSLMLGCPHRADRVVRATVADAWHGRACADERASARIWLYRIATQACVDELARDEVARPRSSNPPWS